MLLYLNEQTYLGEAGGRLAEQLHVARAGDVKVVMVHENDAARGGCDFGVYFDGRTSDDLLQGGLYDDLAVALYSGHFWPTSVALLAKALGANEARSGFQTAGAERSAPPLAPEPAAPRATRAAATAAAAAEAAARHLEREQRRSERRLELQEGFEAGSAANKTCNKDRPGRLSSRDWKPAKPTHTDEERRASWGHSMSKLRSLKSLGGDQTMSHLTPVRLPGGLSAAMTCRARGRVNSAADAESAAVSGGTAAPVQPAAAAATPPAVAATEPQPPVTKVTRTTHERVTTEVVETSSPEMVLAAAAQAGGATSFEANLASFCHGIAGSSCTSMCVSHAPASAELDPFEA